MNKVPLLVLVCAIVGCGGSDVTPDELAGLSGGHEATLTQQHTLAMADELFDFDPTLDPTKTADQNALAISTRATSRMPCATVTLTGTTVTVTAPSTGCTVGNGVAFSGTVAATVTKTGSSLTIKLEFTNFVLSGNAVSGTITLVTSDGTTFQVTYALTRSTKSVSGTLTAVGAPGQITTSGTIDNGSVTATLTNVLWKKGDCYPSSGSLSVAQGRVTTTYTFTSTTPMTGTVSTGKNRTAQLPAYGACPPGADAGK